MSMVLHVEHSPKLKAVAGQRPTLADGLGAVVLLEAQVADAKDIVCPLWLPDEQRKLRRANGREQPVAPDGLGSAAGSPYSR